MVNVEPLGCSFSTNREERNKVEPEEDGKCEGGRWCEVADSRVGELYSKPLQPATCMESESAKDYPTNNHKQAGDNSDYYNI